MKYEMIKSLGEGEFRRLTGVKKSTFSKMAVILEEAHTTKKRRGGRKNTLGIEDMLLMTLEYIREYRTYFHVSKGYGVSESTAYKTIKWVEDTLIQHPDFSLPGRKELLKSNDEINVVLVDATETPIERPKKKQKRFYSGKKKRHTLKSQVAVNKESGRIICTAFSHGRQHDFRLFKDSKVRVHPNIRVLTDSGYQGLQRIHAKTEMPKKRSKKSPLTKEDKANNRQLSSDRILNENVIGKLKRFKILADRYRNRRKRFGLRFNLIAGIYNLELD